MLIPKDKDRALRILVGVITLILAFFIVQNGAVPRKYNLKVGLKSTFDISAPRDIENKSKTKERAENAAINQPSEMKRLGNVPIDVLNSAYSFFNTISSASENVSKYLQDMGITRKDKNYKVKRENEIKKAAETIAPELKASGFALTVAQLVYLIENSESNEFSKFKELTNTYVSDSMKNNISKDQLPQILNEIDDKYQESDLSQDYKNIAVLLMKTIIRPNSIIDSELTEKKRLEAYNEALKNKVIISKDSRIISYGDIVTEDIIEVLNELNLLETGKVDFLYELGLFIIFILIGFLAFTYINKFSKKVLRNLNDLVLLCVILIITLLVGRVAVMYNPLAIPIFIAPVLISILLDVKLAMFLNVILTIAICFINKGDTTFLYMGIVTGSFTAFAASKANQRSQLTAVGLMAAGMNSLIVIGIGMMNKNGFTFLMQNVLIVSVNGIVSIILTIGILPFLEGTFNIITPLKLLELTNPSQPLIKRLLTEAPGTYHHSLMTGNLAEAGAAVVGGNTLLARVGAYYHDVGKLKRPNFFMENQLGENPHDKMTPNLSTLVITSHTQDGVELAQKYNIPLAIREIIHQHHGNTVLVYFYHKAKKSDKGDNINVSDFRYTGPRPSSKEAAVVMLADSIEAAVRAMTERTEGKIEGLIRKIIKDKLDDGQLDSCELTLKDLDEIAKAFLKVFSGFFHEREDYPKIKILKEREEVETVCK